MMKISVSNSLVDIVQYTREEINKKAGYLVSPSRWQTKQTLEALMLLQKVLNKEVKE